MMNSTTSVSTENEARRNFKMKINRVTPAICAWGILLVVTGAFYYLVIPGFVEQFNTLGIIFSILEMLLVLVVISNFLAATVMDPGVLPKASEMEEQQHNEHRTPVYIATEIHGISVRMKWCCTCHFYRPPRCSHCSVCDQCIDSFDHHCPWLNNCIGRRNYRYFFIFLLTLTIHIICVFAYCFAYTLRTKHDLMTKENIGSMIMMIISGITFMPVIGLTSFHVFLVATGRTTNEQMTGKYRNGFNPFNRGFCRNVTVVCCGPQFPKMGDHVGKQKAPDANSLAILIDHNSTTSTAVPACMPSPLSSLEPQQQIHVYTPEDEHGPQRNGHDGFAEYKLLKRQPLDLLRPDLEERASNPGDMSRDSSLVTIGRFKHNSGVALTGDNDSALGSEAQGSKCNLLDETGSTGGDGVPVVNYRRGQPVTPSRSPSASPSMDWVDGHHHHGKAERLDSRQSNPGNERYQLMLKEAYSGAANVANQSDGGGGVLKTNGPANGNYRNPKTNSSIGAPKFPSYVPAASIPPQNDSSVNKSYSMDGLKRTSFTASVSSSGGTPNGQSASIHSSIPSRLVTDANYKRPISFTQAVQMHDSLTKKTETPAAATTTSSSDGQNKRSSSSSSGTGNNINEIRV